MDYKRIYISYDTDYSEALNSISPQEGEYSKSADKEIKKHLNDGWRIVSTAPVIASWRRNAENLSGIAPNKHEWQDYVFTYTNGIEVFLVKD